jgi:hypothetical protein
LVDDDKGFRQTQNRISVSNGTYQIKSHVSLLGIYEWNSLL